MSVLYNKVREKFNLIKFNQLLSKGDRNEIFDVINKITGHNPIHDERIEYGELEQFFNILCNFNNTLEYTPLVSFVVSNEPAVYGENEFGLLKLKLNSDKEFKFYLTNFGRHDFEDRFIEDSLDSYNLFKDNENVDYQNCITYVYEKMERILSKKYINIINFHFTKDVIWSEDRLKEIINNKDIKFKYL